MFTWFPPKPLICRHYAILICPNVSIGASCCWDESIWTFCCFAGCSLALRRRSPANPASTRAGPCTSASRTTPTDAISSRSTRKVSRIHLQGKWTFPDKGFKPELYECEAIPKTTVFIGEGRGGSFKTANKQTMSVPDLLSLYYIIMPTINNREFWLAASSCVTFFT